MIDWGRLDKFPFDAEVWGNVAEWAAAIGTILAFLAAVGIYGFDKFAARRAQARLVYVATEAGSTVTIDNRSEKAIFQVRAVLAPMKLRTALRTGELAEGKFLSDGTVYEYPQHNFYLHVRHELKNRKKKLSAMHEQQKDVEISPNGKEKLLVPELAYAAQEVFIVFRDAHGLDWAINLRTRKLQRAGDFKTPRQWRRWATEWWWLTKNWCRWMWNYNLDHRKGRPDPPFE